MPGADAEGRRGIWYRAFRPSAAKICATRSPAAIQNGQPSVSFTLTGEGGQRFFNFTSAHVGDSLAVVLDNKVRKWPTSKSRSATRARSAAAA